MNITNFIQEFNLYDSFIENIGNTFFKNQLVITVDLCKWQQPDYKDGQPDHVIGNFVFSGVQDITLDMGYFTIHNNSILEVHHDIKYALSKISIVFLVSESPWATIITFKADSVVWNPIVVCST